MSRPEVYDYDLSQGDQRLPINFSIPALSNQDRNGSNRLSMSHKPFSPFIPRSAVHTDSFPRHTQDSFMGPQPTSSLDPRVLPHSPANTAPHNQFSPNQQSTPHFFAQPTSRLPSSSSFHLTKPSPTAFLPYNDTYMPRNTSQNNPPVISPKPSTDTTSTLLWGDLEPWMDEEYAKQVCMIMHWDPISIKVPKLPVDPTNDPQPNNKGYCYLTFSNSAKAGAALSQIMHSPNPTTMPNSSKPFSLTWTTSVPVTPPPAPAPAPAYVPPNPYPSQQSHQFTKEYSIFVGDLAPEVSNSDLVAVFRNPVLGLRNDREPRFIRPFLSCKSAKIMLDPITGVSRGYGFVRSVCSFIFFEVISLKSICAPTNRFTEEADQQRALIEMHGLYCLSRPSKYFPICCVCQISVMNCGRSAYLPRNREVQITHATSGSSPGTDDAGGVNSDGWPEPKATFSLPEQCLRTTHSRSIWFRKYRFRFFPFHSKLVLELHAERRRENRAK